jgi:negative regulator of genetic competence, sporulation and motility
MEWGELDSSGSDQRQEEALQETRYIVFDFHKMQDICCLSEKFLTSQEVCSMELFIEHLVIKYVRLLKMICNFPKLT